MERAGDVKFCCKVLYICEHETRLMLSSILGTVHTARLARFWILDVYILYLHYGRRTVGAKV